MSKYKKIIVAGPLVLEVVYPAPNPRDSTTVRSGKKALSTEAQQRMNLKYAWQKLELEIAANFGVRDLYCTFTYDDEHIPKNRAAANRCIQSFWRKLRAARLSNGKDLVYIYNTESKHGDGRLHHHVLINSTGEDFEEIRKLWVHGKVDFVQIRIDREKNYESLAKYLCKEQREKVGQRLWSSSRNIKKPEQECFRVDDDISIAPPPGAYVLDDSGDRVTQYGHYRYIKFLAPSWDRTKRPKAKRKRTKR